MKDPDFARNSSARQDAWTRYWKSGALHSCPTSFRDNYEGEIAAFWEEAGRLLPARGRILDLATGNGSIPMLLRTQGRDDLDIDATDAADISPAWLEPESHAKTRFHPNVWIEHLPFPDHAFDGICSQFGIEYAEQASAWREVLRVLKAKGGLFVVMHHAESVFTRVATVEIEHLAWLLGPDGLLQEAETLAGWLARLRAGEPVARSAQANAARERFNRMQEVLDLQIRTGTSVDLLTQARSDVQAILARSGQPAADLAAYRSALEENRFRSGELVTHALTHEAVAGLADRLRAEHRGLEVEVRELRQSEGLLAWGLRALPRSG
ncbi:class I SAM-dependent methyltransferase [Luteimonas sp. R10]|uniref:class I SAM-dependent methyltransferase n=1 Tax=Luteimonas sp. R10 TaxID=3108176 RepID=UPI0030913D36|nr:class I SAM-dependent methyltransferase [Luteimonas sp. R10]